MCFPQTHLAVSSSPFFHLLSLAFAVVPRNSHISLFSAAALYSTLRTQLRVRSRRQSPIASQECLRGANFGVPVRWLGAPGFGQATETLHLGVRVQLQWKFLL